MFQSFSLAVIELVFDAACLLHRFEVLDTEGLVLLYLVPALLLDHRKQTVIEGKWTELVQCVLSLHDWRFLRQKNLRHPKALENVIPLITDYFKALFAVYEGLCHFLVLMCHEFCDIFSFALEPVESLFHHDRF